MWNICDCLMFICAYVQAHVYVHTACACLYLKRHTSAYLCVCVSWCVSDICACLYRMSTYLCVHTAVSVYIFMSYCVFWGFCSKKVSLTKTVSGCVMRAFLLWFGPILKCCQTLGLQRKICVSVFTRSCVCVYVHKYLEYMSHI